MAYGALSKLAQALMRKANPPAPKTIKPRENELVKALEKQEKAAPPGTKEPSFDERQVAADPYFSELKRHMKGFEGEPVIEPPKVYRPQDDVKFTEENMNRSELLSETSSQLDRHPLVLEEYARRISKSQPSEWPSNQPPRPKTTPKTGGDLEQQLDEIERELIDEGVLADANVESGLPPEEIARRRLENPPRPKSRLRTDEEQRAVDVFPITKVPPSAAYKGTERYRRSYDDIDLLNESRKDRMDQLEEQLKNNPEINTEANRAILAKDIIESDVADDAAFQVFGKEPQTKHYSKKELLGQKGGKENLSIRELEEIFGRGNTKTSQGRALKNARKEAAQEAERSGRRKAPGKTRQILPSTQKQFDLRRRPNAGELDESIERLTGPKKPQIVAEEAAAAEKVENIRRKLEAARLARDDPSELIPPGPKKPLIVEEGELTKVKGISKHQELDDLLNDPKVKRWGLDWEIRSSYEQGIKQGMSKAEAVLYAIREWDL